jgi:hypothetical protein
VRGVSTSLKIHLMVCNFPVPAPPVKKYMEWVNIFFVFFLPSPFANEIKQLWLFGIQCSKSVTVLFHSLGTVTLTTLLKYLRRIEQPWRGIRSCICRSLRYSCSCNCSALSVSWLPAKSAKSSSVYSPCCYTCRCCQASVIHVFV